MNKMAAQLRQTYEEKDTEELIELSSKTTLTDTAYAVLEAILVSRHVDMAPIKLQHVRNAEQDSLKEEANARLASIPRRLLAKLIDTWGLILLFAIPASVLEAISPGIAALFKVIFLFAFWIYFLFSDGLTGQSVGKRILKIKVIRYGTDLPCTLGQSFWRNLAEVFVFDWLFALGKKRMRLGDMIAGTQVVNAN